VEPIALSIPEAGKALGGAAEPLSRNTIYRMIARGDLEAIKLGSRTLVTTASIKQLAASAPRLAAA
jgi:excisionase family DNA binding protein